jgi:hypothetical protein
MITPPTSEQQQRAKWDLLLRENERRAEQLRNMNRPNINYELTPYEKRLMVLAVGAGAAVFAAGMVMGAFIIATACR